MEFLFHSVIELDGQTTYYNVYRLEEARFLAECHHFNRERACEGDFELLKEGDSWKSASPKHEEVATKIGEEIDRMESDHAAS